MRSRIYRFSPSVALLGVLSAFLIVGGLPVPKAEATALCQLITRPTPIPGTTDLSEGAALARGIDTAARTTTADFGLIVTLTYLSVNNTIETVPTLPAPVRLSIKDDT